MKGRDKKKMFQVKKKKEDNCPVVPNISTTSLK